MDECGQTKPEWARVVDGPMFKSPYNVDSVVDAANAAAVHEQNEAKLDMHDHDTDRTWKAMARLKAADFARFCEDAEVCAIRDRLFRENTEGTVSAAEIDSFMERVFGSYLCGKSVLPSGRSYIGGTPTTDANVDDLAERFQILFAPVSDQPGLIHVPDYVREAAPAALNDQGKRSTIEHSLVTYVDSSSGPGEDTRQKRRT